MKRDEIIDLFIEDKINDWVHGHNTLELEEVLFCGWKGYEDYTDLELEEAFEILIPENFDEVTAEKIRTEQKRIEAKFDEQRSIIKA